MLVQALLFCVEVTAYGLQERPVEIQTAKRSQARPIQVLCMISEYRLLQLKAMLAAGISDRFYDWPEWKRVRRETLNMDHNECQVCRSCHRVGPANLVHHVKHLKDRPDLALSIFDPDTGQRQLLSVCRACHEILHPERMQRDITSVVPLLTEERWD